MDLIMECLSSHLYPLWWCVCQILNLKQKTQGSKCLSCRGAKNCTLGELQNVNLFLSFPCSVSFLFCILDTETIKWGKTVSDICPWTVAQRPTLQQAGYLGCFLHDHIQSRAVSNTFNWIPKLCDMKILNPPPPPQTSHRRQVICICSVWWPSCLLLIRLKWK